MTIAQAEYDDAASATPTDAEILSSLRGLYASDAAAAMAAEDDVRTVRAFLARRKNYAFPPAAAVPRGWSISASDVDDSVLVCAPHADPGGLWVENKGMLEQRLLYALARDLLATTQ